MVNTLAHKAVLAHLQISVWNAHKFDLKVTHEIQQEYHAGHDTGRYNKRLLPRSDLLKIVSVVDRARNRHFHLTSPWLDSGPRVCPTAIYTTWVSNFKELRLEFDNEVDTFLRDYPNAIERWRKQSLNGLFNRADYPTVAQLRRKFSFEAWVDQITDTSDIRCNLSPKDIKEMQLDLKERQTDIMQNALSDKAEKLHELVAHMAERLKSYKPSKGKGQRAQNTFKDSLVDKVRDLADLLPAFNLTGDRKLTAITKRVVEQLCEHDADVLREDAKVRKIVQKSAEQILKDVSAFMA